GRLSGSRGRWLLRNGPERHDEHHRQRGGERLGSRGSERIVFQHYCTLRAVSLRSVVPAPLAVTSTRYSPRASGASASSATRAGIARPILSLSGMLMASGRPFLSS